MDGTHELERRMFAEAPGLEVKTEDNGRTVIRGYAAVFESESQDLGGFVEIVERGAFDAVMKSNPDVFGKYNHERVIGRTSSGTMRLTVDDRGLRYEIDPPHSAADVVELIQRGDVRGSSFAFRTSPKDEVWERDAKGRQVRRIRSFSFLGDAGPVDQPAYLATETYVSKRALEMAAAIVEEPADERQADPVVEDTAEPLVDTEVEGFVDDEDEERAVSLKPTSGMAAAAKRGLRLHEEGKSGDGLKPETVARANRLARREEMNEDWVREMNAWFARHESASKSPGWDTPGEEKPGFVAWLLWGGTPAKNWAARKVAAMDAESDRSATPVAEERSEPQIDAVVSVDTTDFAGKIAALKATMLLTELHGGRGRR
jgi:HK97 family phage prohead protease